MRACPFCRSGEFRTIQVEDSWLDENKFRVVCEICDAMGPSSKTAESAEKYWDGYLLSVDNPAIREEAMGGVSAPMATLNNTPGVGNVQPASGVNNGSIGSGDSFSDTINDKPYTQGSSKKKKKRKKIRVQKRKKEKVNEGNINPYDKIGQAMAKKLKITPPLKKKKEKEEPENQNAMELDQSQFEHQIVTLDDFSDLMENNGKIGE